jgi:DNA-binding MarR family transcriptional regulator
MCAVSLYILGVNDSNTISQMVLETLRRINRAIGLRSRQLVKTVGLTVPQLLVLRKVVEEGETAIGHVAEGVSLSQATVTTIVDRLEAAGLLVRRRGETDRRKVLIAATETGRTVVARNPTILQEEFTEAFSKLENWEQTQILSSLQHVAAMMKAQQLPATPILHDETWSEQEGASADVRSTAALDDVATVDTAADAPALDASGPADALTY